MNRNSDICLITNIGPHYRLPIFKEIRKELNCDFFLGDHIDVPIKTFEYDEFDGCRGVLRNIFFNKYYWQKKSVRLVFASYKYYILDGEPYNISSWAILILAKIMRKKTIAWTHGWYGRESFIKRLIKKSFYKLFTDIMTYSDYSRRLMLKQGFHDNQLYCIANSMDSDREKLIRSTLTKTDLYTNHFHNNDPVVIYCGRIQKRKKLEMIIDSIHMLQINHIRCNIVFVGKDVDNVNIEAYANSKGMSNHVWCYGPCYDDTILGTLFYNATVCVSPGNVGLTAIHSLTFGCPVITHDNFAYQMPEFEAIIAGHTGDFFEYDNISSLADKIRIWISKTEAQREIIRQAAYAEIDNKWNIHYQVHVIKKIINEE